MQVKINRTLYTFFNSRTELLMKNDYFLGLSEEGFHKVNYFEWGLPNPKKNPIICVHGMTRNARDFDALANFLSNQDYHLFCPDIVGRGDSDWLNHPAHYTYEQYLADMNAMIARTGANAVDWIGTSMGGLIGMVLASLPKTPIRRLILNDVGPQIPLQAITKMTQFAGSDPEFSHQEEAKAYFKRIYSDFGSLSEQQWQEITASSIRQTSSGKWVMKIDPAAKQSSLKSKLAWKFLLNPHKALEGTFFDVDLWDIWRKLTCPVLVIHGKNSDLLLPSIIEKMRMIHPRTEIIEVNEAGHAPTLQTDVEQQGIYQWLQKTI